MPKDQSEFPMVDRYLKMMPIVEKNQKIFACQIKAIKRYQARMAKATAILMKELEECMGKTD
jgi:hypothetical protein